MRIVVQGVSWTTGRQGTPLHRFNNDMVFVDGELLNAKGWEGALDTHSFYIDYKSGYVYIGVDPTHRLVEITAFDSALVRTSAPVHGKTSDHKGPVIRGITVAAQCAGRREGAAAGRPANQGLGTMNERHD
jgi:hypothetical protein